MQKLSRCHSIAIGNVLFVVLISLSITAAYTAEKPELPYQDPFHPDVLDRWILNITDGNDFELKQNWIWIEANENSLAHIQKPLGDKPDNITIAVKVGWYGSVYVVWDENNWIGFGKFSPAPWLGRFYSTSTIDGKNVLSDHRGCQAGSHHYLQIQLVDDCIRLSYSHDSLEWIHLRTLERKGGFSGSPSMVALGKHYGSGQNPFASDSLQASENPGGRFPAHFSEFSINETPPNTPKMTAAEKQRMNYTGEDTVGLAILSRAGDPTYASVSGYYPAMRYAREVVGVPLHPLAIGVDWLGRMDVNPWASPVACIRADDSLLPFVEAHQPLKRQLLDGYLPVITLNTTLNNIQYEQSVFGWSQDMSPNDDLFAYVRLRVKAPNASMLHKQISLCYEGGQAVTWDLPQTSAGSGELHFRYKYPEPGSAVSISADEFNQKLDEVVSHWRNRIASAERFDIPDRHVSEAYRTWIVYSMLNTDMVNDYPEPHDGSGFYEEIFGYSATLYSMAMNMYGLHDYAEQILDTLIHFQQPDGLYIQAYGLPDHGTFLLALAYHYEITRDDAWLQRVAPHILSACEWALQQRREAPQEGHTKGLIKFRAYHDHLNPVFNIQGNAYLYMGLQAAAKVLRAAGMSAEADKYAFEAMRFRRDILACMDASAFEDGDMTILPMEPDTHRLLELSRNRGGDYYGLVASMLLETDFLPVNDKREFWITEMLERRQGLVVGVSEFMEGIDHAYGYGYLMTQMKRDDIRKVVLGFWSMMAYGMTRDTYSPVEASQIMTGENQLTLPHLYSCTQQLRLLRNMLIWEDGNILRIGHAIPREWLEPGKKVSVRAAPTRFGEISFQIISDTASTMSVNINPPRNAPGETRIRLRHPERMKISEVRVSPDKPLRVSGEDIIMGRLSEPVELKITFRE